MVDVKEKDPVSFTGSIDSRSFEQMGIARPLEAEILKTLLEGRRTVTELCESIYDLERTGSSFHTYYMKVSRAVKELQRRGFVSTRVFGRDKPYTLTPFAAAQMMNLEKKEVKIVPLIDTVAYTLTAGLGLVTLYMILSGQGFDNLYTMLVYSVFLILVGFSSSRLYNAFKKVS